MGRCVWEERQETKQKEEGRQRMKAEAMALKYLGGRIAMLAREKAIEQLKKSHKGVEIYWESAEVDGKKGTLCMHIANDCMLVGEELQSEFDSIVFGKILEITKKLLGHIEDINEDIIVKAK